MDVICLFWKDHSGNIGKLMYSTQVCVIDGSSENTSMFACNSVTSIIHTYSLFNHLSRSWGLNFCLKLMKKSMPEIHLWFENLGILSYFRHKFFKLAYLFSLSLPNVLSSSWTTMLTPQCLWDGISRCCSKWKSVKLCWVVLYFSLKWWSWILFPWSNLFSINLLCQPNTLYFQVSSGFFKKLFELYWNNILFEQNKK